MLPIPDNIDEYVTCLEKYLKDGNIPSLNANVKKAVFNINVSL